MLSICNLCIAIGHIISIVSMILIHISDGVMADIIPSSHRTCLKIVKMASHEPIMQSIIDCSAKLMIGCEKRVKKSW